MTQSAKFFSPSSEQLRVLKNWRISTFWVMLIGYIGYYLCRGNLAVALPLLSKEFQYTNTQLGVILTFSELAYALGKFTLGPAADRIGGKTVFITGLLGAIVFNLLFPLFTTIFAFTVVWCFCRFFLSMGWGGIIKTIGEWYEPEKNGTIMGLISINFQFGSVLASLFCGYLIALGSTWKGLFYYPAAIAVIIVIWAILASRESPQNVLPGVRFGKNAGQKKSLAGFDDEEKVDSKKILKKLLSIQLFRQLIFFSLLTHFLRSIFLFWTPKFLVDIGMGAAGAAMMSAVFPLMGCLGTVFLGWYTDKKSKSGDRTRMMSVMLLLLIFSLFATSVLIPIQGTHAAIVVLLGLSGFFLYGPYSMAAGALSLDIAGPRGAGTCTGIIDGVGYIGGALAAWGAGVLSDRLGWSQVFLVLSAVAVLTAAWTFYMSYHFKKSRRA